MIFLEFHLSYFFSCNLSYQQCAKQNHIKCKDQIIDSIAESLILFLLECDDFHLLDSLKIEKCEHITVGKSWQVSKANLNRASTARVIYITGLFLEAI